MENTLNRNRRSAKLDLEKLKEHYKIRAASPPVEALPRSSTWQDYEEEMREIERQLTEMGVIL